MAKKPLHIAILSTFFDPFMSGAEMCVDELANRLGRKDAFAITIITARLDRSLPKYENRGRYVMIRVGFGYKWDKWIYPLIAPFATKKIGADIVHAVMESYAAIALWLYGFISHGSRRILTLQSGDLDEKAQRGKIPQWLWAKIHKSPDIVTAISKSLHTRAQNVGAKRIELIPNGVNIGKLTFIKNKVEEKTEATFGCVARLSPEKGVKELIQAFGFVREKIPDAQLHVIGGGDQKEELEQLIVQIGAQDNITLHGRLPYEQAMKVLAQTKVAIMPSRAEGLGIAGLEAMALGLPVVATRVGGIPDFVKHEINGLLVEPMNIKELAEGMVRMMTDQTLYESACKNAIATVEQYEWKTIIARYADMYREILKPRICIATGIYPPDPGGPATYAEALRKTAEDKGVHMGIVTFAEEKKWDTGTYTEIHTVPRNMSRIERYVLYTMTLMSVARRYDVMYAQDSLSVGIPTRIVAKILNKPYVVKVVGDPAWERAQQAGLSTANLENFQSEKHHGKIKRVQKWFTWVLKGADHIITPSNYLKSIVQMWGIVEEKITVIYNAAHPPTEYQPIDNWPSGKTILYVGRLVSWKGLEHLIGIADMLVREFKDVKVVLLGEGPERSKLEQYTEERELKNVVWMPGLVTHAQAMWAMQQASVFTLFSTYEGLPHVLIEAQHNGVPIVASTAGGNGEVITHNHSGLLVDPKDNMGLYKSIRLVLTDEATRNNLIKGGHESVQRFNRQKMCDDTISFFNTYARSSHQF